MPLGADRVGWWRRQREVVVEYLARQGVDHGGVADEPGFDVHPHVSLWAVQSRRAPGAVGWWAIAGDLPTDYLSSRDGRSPREALRAIAARWRDAADHMARGEPHPDVVIGAPEQWPALSRLLGTRSELLGRWADDDALWEVDGGAAEDPSEA